MTPSPIWHSWSRPALPVVVVALLLSPGVSNIAAKVNWRPFEDGVFWTTGVQGVVANIIAADAPAKGSGLQVNDLLLAIDDEPVQRPSDVSALLQQYGGQIGLRYTILRSGSQVPIDLRIQPTRPVIEPLYFILAAVGIFTLLVGGAVRLRRPRDPATLHFLWLAAAFYGVFVFSYTGRFDRLDWIYYWADVIAMLHAPENTEKFIAAEAVPVDATASDVIDERTVRLNSMLGEAAVVISPADTGYDLEVADAFYRALAEVLGGRTSADDAATQLASQVE